MILLQYRFNIVYLFNIKIKAMDILNNVEKGVQIEGLKDIDFTFKGSDGHEYRVNFNKGSDGVYSSTLYIEYQHGKMFNCCDKIGDTQKHPRLTAPAFMDALVIIQKLTK